MVRKPARPGSFSDAFARRLSMTMTYDPLTASLAVLHDRKVVNQTALLRVLQGLEDGKPLTLEQLAAIFGVEPIYTLLTPREADGRLLAQFTHIHDLLLDALEVDDLRTATLQLVTLLRDEWCRLRLEARR